MRQTYSLAFLVASAALLSACSSTKLDEKPVVEERTTPPATTATTPADIRTVTAVAIDPLNDKNGPLAKRSVYFDYDSYAVREDGKSVVTAHAGYLTKNTGRAILIQGNTDERGGREYNLALGQKRAEAVRKSLAATGVADGQMEAVSLGKEKPKAMGSDEAAYAENRRADIVYK